MAWTTTKNFEFVPGGNHRMQLWQLTANSATLELDTGLPRVDHAQLTPGSAVASAASFGVAVKINADSGASAYNGRVSLTGAVSGNDYFLMVIGH